MKELRTEFKIAGAKAPFSLFPIPVIENKKFLISIHSKLEAKLLRHLLKEKWIEIDPDKPSSLWRIEAMHVDGNTRVFSPVWESLKLKYLKMEHPLIENILSKVLSNWIKSELSEEKESYKLKKTLETKIKAQLRCKSCLAKGIPTEKMKEFLRLVKIKFKTSNREV